ncbi:MAG: lamin tail domain-containing protein, partial [Anaerolineales bacterium]
MLINELAWAGTRASAHDEWIELHNPGPEPISLEGWQLTDEGDINIDLEGTIGSFGFFLLERTDDTTISSIGADLIYTGSMRNSGEGLQLLSPDGHLIDSANLAGGSWPAGDSGSRASMERLGGGDIPGNWVTFAGVGFAHDADGNLINGTPRTTNSAFLPTATPTATPPTTPTPTMTAAESGSVLINEVAWAGTRASANDEWIELFNPGPEPISLDGWKLTDDGDLDIPLGGELPAFSFLLLERTDDSTISSMAADIIYSGSLRNSGESLSLLDSSGNLID